MVGGEYLRQLLVAIKNKNRENARIMRVYEKLRAAGVEALEQSC